MLKKRLIPAIILLNGMVVQSINFKLTNLIGNAITAVDFFNRWAADEIVILDVSRDQSKRDNLYGIIQDLSKKCFVPLTVGGWVTTTEEMKRFLNIGADKVIVNTAAFQDSGFITKCADIFGSQCVVVSIDAKQAESGYEVYIDRGRKATGVSPLDWAKEAQKSGAGEIYLTSIDHDGSRKGYDLSLIRSVVEAVDIPVIAFGGAHEWDHFVEGIKEGGAEAVAAANVFHYKENSAIRIKEHMKKSGIDVR